MKQFAYELSIKEDLQVETNMLMLPTEDHDTWVLAGVLHMAQSGSRDHRFRTVSVIALNWKYLSRLYVRREWLGEDFILQLTALTTSNQQFPVVQA